MKKILICGLGSIGQRHLRQIKSIKNSSFEICALRSRKIDFIISDNLVDSVEGSPEEYYKINVFYNIQEALEWKPDAVFVTNPISMHVSTALRMAENGSHIFIEKPLDSSTKEVSLLKNLVKEKKLVCMIGYQLRFHPGYLKVKELIVKNLLGRICYADLHFGEWLPGMHPYEDYRISHASRSEEGGGVIFCLSHKIDLAYWLFGMPKSIYCAGGKLSNLEIDVEDTADMILNFVSKDKIFPTHIHLDFLQKSKKCYLHIVGDKGSVYFDYCTNQISIEIEDSKKEIISFNKFERNDMFRKEISAFFQAIKRGTQPPITLNEAHDVLLICKAAKDSLSKNSIYYFS